jgi:hypothetical protein
MAAAAAGVAAPSRGDDEWLRAYDRVVAMLPRVEALAAGRARLEAVNALQHEFWEARDALFQQRLLQVIHPPVLFLLLGFRSLWVPDGDGCWLV